jgi:hypothetical protein
MGQPILVGHHSEGRHRRALERSDNAMRKAHEESERAKELQHRADAVGTGGISSDDPQAVEKLREKLADFENSRDLQKRINTAWRKCGKPAPDNAEAWQSVADEVGISDNILGKVRLNMARQPYHKAPFPSYVFQNCGANIRRIKQRIEELETAASVPEAPPAVFEGFTVREDKEENRICIEFPGKPSADVRAILKGHGWRWNRRLTAWTRHLNNGGRHSAEWVAEKLTAELQKGGTQ